MIMAGKVPKITPYAPWYKSPTNTHVRTDDMFDVDRQGNGFVVTVYEYLNKKKETCQEVIRVKHMGKITMWDLIDKYDCKRIHVRAYDSGDLLVVYQRLSQQELPRRTQVRDWANYAIKAGSGGMTDLVQIWPPVEAK